eukprot:g26429.t1
MSLGCTCDLILFQICPFHPGTEMTATTGKKALAFVMLILQSTSLVLMMRYSRTRGGKIYRASSAVLALEVVKVLFCLVTLTAYHGCSGAVRKLVLHTVGQPREMAKMALPALLYAMQNNLLYFALSNLDPAPYQVIYQLKTLSTACFSVALLSRRLSALKWASLVLLMIGCALVQLQLEPPKERVSDAAPQRPVLGVAAVLLSCITSGFAGVYFEKVLKSGKNVSLWMRNVQLGLFGTAASLAIIVYQDLPAVLQEGLWVGFDRLTVAVVLNQALGGIMVSIVVKYADNILKGFAMAISIVLGCLFSTFFLDFYPTKQFALGTFLVCLSLLIYAEPSFLTRYCEPLSFPKNSSAILPFLATSDNKSHHSPQAHHDVFKLTKGEKLTPVAGLFDYLLANPEPVPRKDDYV